MFGLMTSLFLSSSATAAKIPGANYQLQLDDYNIELQDFRFPSGLRILMQSERSQPIVAVTAVIDRGSEYDQPEMDGIAHVLEHLAFRANHSMTEDNPGLKNWDLIAQMGGTINASTSVDWTNYMTIAPRDALIPLVRIEALRLKNGMANITEQDVITESEIARNELRMRYENAAVGAAWDELGNALFPSDHPYARSTIGSHETLSNISKEAVLEYAANYYRPEFTTMVVVGDFDLSEASDIIFEAFDGNEDLLMSPEDAKKYTALDTQNAQIEFLNDYWGPSYGEYVQSQIVDGYLKPYPSRVQCDQRAEPPMPNQKEGDELPRVKGMIDRTTVVLGWSLPGGYCEDEPTMSMAANILSSYITQELVPTWEIGREDQSISGVGCFASPDEYFTQVFCFIEQGVGGSMSPEKLAEKAKGALVQQWQQYDPNMVNTQVQSFFNYARSSQMAGMLQSADSVSNLFSGRATATAMYTHFTGDARYFTSNMQRISQITPKSTREMAIKYLTRERAVAVVVEPMDEEERERREAKARMTSRTEKVQEYHATQDSDRYSSLFDAEKVTPEIIKQQLVTPDLTEMHSFTLDNGLAVHVLPYGDAPFVRATLRLKGSTTASEPKKGMNAMMEYTVKNGYGVKENLLAVAGFQYGSDMSLSASVPSGNLGPALHQLRWYFEDEQWRSNFERKNRAKSWSKSVKTASKTPETWASRMQMSALLPDHPLGDWFKPEDYDVMKTWKLDELKEWYYTKWQPANAEMYIVGKLDVQETEELVRTYMDSWIHRGSGEPGELSSYPPPPAAPERQVLIFDKPIATQSQVSLMCHIDAKDRVQEKGKAQVVGDVLSQMAWRKLREEAGVTYGAGAYAMQWDGGTAALAMNSLVQNDAVSFTVNTMFDIIATGAAGDVSVQPIADASIKRAREYVLGQQSGDQMLSRLTSVGYQNFSFFETYGDQLASVRPSDFTAVLEPCKGKEVVTIIGPKQYASEQLDEAGIPYQIVDWEALHLALLTPKELKKLEKSKAKAAKKAEASGTDSLHVSDHGNQ